MKFRLTNSNPEYAVDISRRANVKKPIVCRLCWGIACARHEHAGEKRNGISVV